MPKPLSAEERLEWGAKICQQQKSGLSICRWCRENQVAIGPFHYWKRHLQPKKELTRSSFTELSMDQDTGIALGQDTGITLDVWRQLSLPVDDNYLCRFSLVRKAGVSS